MRSDKASNTARLIARSILLASHDPRLRELVAEGESEITARILEETGGNLFSRLALYRIPRSLLLGLERAMLPGIIAHYLVRKRRIARAVRESLASGMKRVVVIAAGYDSLCARLKNGFPEVDFIEIDHPATQGAKRRALPESHNFRYIAADLSKESLSGHFPLDFSAVIVIEGLTMYLEEEAVSEIFQKLAPACGTLIFTFMEKDENGSIAFRGQSPVVRAWLRKRGEPFLWGIARSELPSFLERCGFQCLEIIDDVQLRDEFLTSENLRNLPLARGECICVAQPLER